jgi:dUTP pyrophosphatase
VPVVVLVIVLERSRPVDYDGGHVHEHGNGNQSNTMAMKRSHDAPRIETAVHVCPLPHAAGLALPAYETADAAGMDLRAALPEDAPLTLSAGAWALVPTGLTVAIPPGYEAQVRPRSGLALNHGIGVLNSPGTIDADYRGEVRIILFNFSGEDFVIRRGERIAQLVLHRVERLAWRTVDALPPSGRGDGGFGHTGKE